MANLLHAVSNNILKAFVRSSITRGGWHQGLNLIAESPRFGEI